MSKTLDQERALFTWELVGTRRGKDLENNLKAARKAGMLVNQAGLLQTLAWLKTQNKGENNASILLKGLEHHLRQTLRINSADTAVLDYLMNADQVFLRLATEESIALLQWVKQHADGMGD